MHLPKAGAEETGIAAATLADFSEIDRIQNEAFTTPWSTDLIRAAILNRKYEVRVLKTDVSPVAGFYISHVSEDRSNLDNLAVDSALRGNGLGRQLLQDWIDRSGNRKLAMLSLQVNTHNLGAQRLYHESAFKKTRLLVGYYPNGEDAYQMELTLQPRRPAAAKIH